MSAAFDEKIHQTLGDSKLQFAIYASTARLIAKRQHALEGDNLPDYQELRTHANALKKHTIDNLDYYLEQFEANVAAHGGKVIYAKDATEVADFVLSLAKERGSHLIVKSKSMTTEEVDLNQRLEHHNLESVETDLGEYIIQLAHQRPYHIVAPALHMTRFQVADLLTEKLGVPNETVIEKQTMIARAVLREKFLTADIGVSGANFLIADSGAVGVAELRRRQRLGRRYLEQRQICLLVAPDQLGRQRTPVVQRHRDLIGALDHMVVGHDVAAGIDDEARAQRGDVARQARPGAEEILEQVGKRRTRRDIGQAGCARRRLQGLGRGDVDDGRQQPRR